MPRVIKPVDLTYEDLDAVPDLPFPPLAQQAGQAAREFVCGLYEAYPGGMLQVGSTALRAITGKRTLLDQMCRPIGRIPPDPQKQFTGGQCPGVIYQVRVNTQRLAVYAFGFRTEEEQISDNVFAPIEGVYASGAKFLRFEGQTVKTFRYLDVDAYEQLSPGQFARKRYRFRDYETAANVGLISVLSVVPERLFGGADNCGDPAPRYPDVRPPLASVQNTVNLQVSPTLQVNAPITLIPTLIAPIGVSVRPEFNVKVGDLTVNFAQDGVRITDDGQESPSFDPDFDPREFPPDSIIIEGDEIASEGCDLAPVLDKLDEIQDEIEECCDRNFPYQEIPVGDYSFSVLGEGGSGDFDLPAKTFRVVVQIIDPSSVKSREDGESAPDVLYAGWAWFDAGGGMGQRQPIDSVFKSFEPPQRSAPRFAYTLRSNYNAKVTAYFYTE